MRDNFPVKPYLVALVVALVVALFDQYKTSERQTAASSASDVSSVAK